MAWWQLCENDRSQRNQWSATAWCYTTRQSCSKYSVLSLKGFYVIVLCLKAERLILLMNQLMPTESHYLCCIFPFSLRFFWQSDRNQLLCWQDRRTYERKPADILQTYRKWEKLTKATCFRLFWLQNQQWVARLESNNTATLCLEAEMHP